MARAIKRVAEMWVNGKDGEQTRERTYRNDLGKKRGNKSSCL